MYLIFQALWRRSVWGMILGLLTTACAVVVAATCSESPFMWLLAVLLPEPVLAWYVLNIFVLQRNNYCVRLQHQPAAAVAAATAAARRP